MLFEAILITGTPFSGKTTLAKILAEHFGWKYFSIGDVWRDTWKKKFPNGETSFENYMEMTSDDEHREVDKKTHEIIAQGHVIIDMTYGFLHRDPQVLIVFTRCEIDAKAKRALEVNRYPGKNFDQVKQVLEQRKRNEIERGKRLYNEDFTDEKNYDLKFDTTNASPDEAIEKILSLE